MESFRMWIELVGMAVDGAGVAIVVIGATAATARFVYGLADRAGNDAYRDYRQRVGRSILLGLEFLVAGDIIRTVAVDPTLDKVIVLALVVLIRTFLSTALELELEGHWPWARRKAQAGARGPEPT